MCHQHVTDTAGMQAEVTALVDPASWPTDLDATFCVWMPENDTAPRPTEDGSDWLSSRDADGSIRTDLDELGMLDHGITGNRDAVAVLPRPVADPSAPHQGRAVRSRHDRAPPRR